MASTDDCKKLLDSDEKTQGRGPWKRLSKRNADDGVERIFSNKDQTCFVRMLETDTGISINKTGSSQAEVDTTAAAVAPAGPTLPINLFTLFPPDFGTTDEYFEEEMETDRATFREDFSGRMVYGFDSLSEDEFIFEFGYETSDGWLYDQHSSAVEHMLFALFPEYADRLSANIAESVHEIEIGEGDTSKKLKRIVEERLKAAGAVSIRDKRKTTPVGQLPEGAPIFGPREIDNENTLVSVIQASALDGKTLLTATWQYLPPDTQKLLQQWTREQGVIINKVDPNLAATWAARYAGQAEGGYVLADGGSVISGAPVEDFFTAMLGALHSRSRHRPT